MAEGVRSAEHFVKQYQADLIKRVSNIEPILDEFLHKNIIKQFSYDEIHSLPTSQKKMTALFSGPLQSSQGKAMFYKLLNKHDPDLIDELGRTEVATMAVKETLKDLSSEEFKKFKWLLQFPLLQLGLSQIPTEHLYMEDRADILVDVMVQKLGQQYVEVIKEVLMDMNRTDLVQRLSETSPGLKEKHFVDEPWSALIQKQVESIESDIQLLLETLAGLSDRELQQFEDVLLREIYVRDRPLDSLLMTFEVLDKQNIVLSIVLIHGQQSVDKTMEVLMKMNRTDLVQLLSQSSSGPKKKLSDEYRSALIQKVVTKSAVKHLLLETMKEFDYFEFGKFPTFLQLIVLQKNLPDISLLLRRTEDRARTVDLMMQAYGYQSVDLTREVVHKMSSEFKASLPRPRPSKWLFHSKGPSVDEKQSALSESEATVSSVKWNLLKTLEDLNDENLEKFKHVLQYSKIKKDLPKIPSVRLETANRVEMVELMMETYDQQSVEVTKEVLEMMNRRDLVKRFSDFSLGSKRPARSLDHKDSGSIAQVSRDWTKLDPEVNSNNADEAPTYSLQSEAGTFECSVSGLRWICKGKVSFKYQFCSLEEHMESIGSLQYMPAGPLMDITDIAGKLDEVHLPHWICIDDNPTILDQFAVLHIDDCGVVVEKVSEVTPSHVKLCEPVFSPRAVLMRVGFTVKIYCNVLIYKTNTAFLTLHVYLIPRDPGLQQVIKKTEKSYGCKEIRKPNPEKFLKMKDCFILTTDLDGANIGPKTLKLRYENPNYFQVLIDNPDTNFNLKLTKENESQEVWTGTILRDEYNERAVRPSAGETGAEGDSSGKHFVDRHFDELVARVSETGSIMDELLREAFMSQEMYSKISAEPTNMAKMRMIYTGPLNAAGRRGKDFFEKLLEKYEKRLIDDIKNK